MDKKDALHRSKQEAFFSNWLWLKAVVPIVGPLDGSKDQTLRNPSCVILSHTQLRKTDLKLQVDALANAPMAFVDALAALQTAGLSPLSDPRRDRQSSQDKAKILIGRCVFFLNFRGLEARLNRR